MNWLDIILIIIIAFLLFGGLIWLFLGIKEDEYGPGIIGFIIVICVIFFIFGVSFLIVDKKSGSAIGEITSVDENFFGTTAVYLKVNDNSEERYCIENKDLIPLANEMLGKKVKITYGKRVGIYSTGACNNAPIDKIEPVESE